MAPSPPENPRENPRAKALLLDLDGTLVDSAPDLAAALNRLLAGNGRAAVTLAAVKAMIGDGVAKLVERGFAATGALPAATDLAAAVARFKQDYESALAVETRPYPGVPETLTTLHGRGWRLGVCTNKPHAASLQVIEAFALSPPIEAVAGGDHFPVRKPDPGHLLGTLELLGIAPEAAVMVGDSRNDVLSARNAGLPVIVLSYGYGNIPARELGADLVIDRFEELPAALGTLGF